MNVDIYRYNPEIDKTPHMRTYTIDFGNRDAMILDVLEALKEQDQTLTFRRSCREGVCGSDGMNINGKNGLACITPISDALARSSGSARTHGPTLILRPLPGMPVIRDLVVDLSLFFTQYKKVRPWLINDEPAPPIERLQTPGERAKLDGLYECILCACCTSACPSWWWNPDRYIGPAGLLNALRFIDDSRDAATEERLEKLQDPYSLFRCRNIQNCTSVCPKGLNPMHAIDSIRRKMTARGF